MKSNATFLGSAIATGAGAGFLLSLLLPGADPASAQAGPLRDAGSRVESMLAEVQKIPAVQAFESTVSKLAAVVLPPAKPKTAVMLLSEPVVILTGTSNGWQHLDAGKQVTLIANEGRFIRVKYEEKEVCIPRSAVTNGIASFR